MKTKRMTVSIIIINWNGKNLLRKCLPSVITAAEYVKKRYEIIIVDNDSTDGSVQFLKSKFPKVKVIILKENTGFVRGSNMGVKSAKGDILVFLNNDIMVRKDSFKYLLKHLKKPNIFGVSPKLIKWDKKTIQTEFLGCSFVLGMVVRTEPNINKIDMGEFKEPRLTFIVPGGASAIDRKKFLKLGGFDEIYSPFYWEDTDLSYRAYKRGWVCLYEPKAVFYHKHRATLSKTFTEEALQLQELKTRFIFTWSNFYDPKILLKHFMFLPVILLGSVLITPFRTKRFMDIRAFFQALKHWREIVGKRARERKYAKLSDKEALNLINSNNANELAPVSFWKFAPVSFRKLFGRK